MDLKGTITSSTETAGPTSLNSSIDEDDQVQLKDDNTDAEGDSSMTTAQQRRELLGSQLSSYKQEKLKRKLPVDSQFLNCAKKIYNLRKSLLTRWIKWISYIMNR